MSTVASPANIQSFVAKEEQYEAPEIVVKQALLSHWQEEYDRSIADPQKFWGKSPRVSAGPSHSTK